jgi:hypothetical protein
MIRGICLTLGLAGLVAFGGLIGVTRYRELSGNEPSPPVVAILATVVVAGMVAQPGWWWAARRARAAGQPRRAFPFSLDARLHFSLAVGGGIPLLALTNTHDPASARPEISGLLWGITAAVLLWCIPNIFIALTRLFSDGIQGTRIELATLQAAARGGAPAPLVAEASGGPTLAALIFTIGGSLAGITLIGIVIAQWLSGDHTPWLLLALAIAYCLVVGVLGHWTAWAVRSGHSLPLVGRRLTSPALSYVYAAVLVLLGMGLGVLDILKAHFFSR